MAEVIEVPNLIQPILDEILASAAIALEDAGLKPGRIVHSPGLVVTWDDCDCEGQLAIHITRTQPLKGNQRSANGMPCFINGWVYTVGLQFVHCVATIDDEGYAPAAETVIADSQRIVREMNILSQVILCNPNTYDVIQWVPLGPTGGCGGGEWQFQVRTGYCGC